MKPILLSASLLAGILLLLGSAPEPARADGDSQPAATDQEEMATIDAAVPAGAVSVRSKRERRLDRMTRWHELLQGDRRRIHDEMGHPTYRGYELEMGVRTELWTYPEADRIYVFEGDRLVDTRLD